MLGIEQISIEYFRNPLWELVLGTLDVGLIALFGALIFGRSRAAHWFTRADHKFGESHRPEAAIGVLAAGAVFFYGSIRYYLFQSFQIGIWDFGSYDSVIWRMAHGLSGEMVLLGRAHWLGDHFQPILVLFAPLYWLWDSPHALLSAELLVVVSGVIPIALLARHYFRSGVLRVALAGAYLAFPGMYAALLFPFHPSTLVAPLLLWVFYCFDTERWWGYWIALGLALMTKENAGVYLAVYGLWQMFQLGGKKGITDLRRKAGWITMLLGTVIAAGSVFFLIPYLRQGPYSQNYWLDPQLTGAGVGWDSGSLNLLSILTLATNHPWKWQAIITGFASFGFLPLLFLGFFPFLPFLAERLLTGQQGIYSPFFHYGAPIAAPFIYMAIRAIQRWEHRLPLLALVAIPMLAAGSVFSYRALEINPVARLRELKAAATVPHIVSLNRILKLIPPKASIFTQDVIAAHLAHRAEITPLEFESPAKPEYVLFDITVGLGHASPERLQNVIRTTLANPNYTLIVSEGPVALWQLGGKVRVPESLELSAFLHE